MNININIISKKKLICVNEKYQIFCRGYKIYIRNVLTKKNSVILIPTFTIKRWLSYFSLTRRFFRLEPRCGYFINENLIIFSIKGRIYNLNLVTNNIEIEHFLKKGMSSPLFFSEIKDLEGFENGIVYGEYIGGGINNTVDIYMRTKTKVWKKVYSFPSKTIKHIHNVIPSKKLNCLFVLTGDSDLESGIWKIESGFKKSTQVVGGSQKYRGCFAFEYKYGLLYASDIPTRENFLYYLEYSDLSLKKLMPISGPCIYGTKLNNGDYMFGTSVEPNDNANGFSSLFCFKKGFGIKDNKSHLYIGNPEKGFLDIYQRKKDFLPMPLFGLGVFQFPHNQSKNLYFTCQAMQELDGYTLKINMN